MRDERNAAGFTARTGRALRATFHRVPCAALAFVQGDASPAGGEPPPPPADESLWEGASRWLTKPLLEIGENPLTITNIVVAVLVLLLAFQFSKFLQGVLERGLRGLGVDTESTLGTIGRLVHYSVVILGVVVAIQQLGFELQTLLAAGAVFAVAFGFAMQNIAQNFVSGVILLIERSIKPGDVLEVEGRIVRVVEMGIRSTVARTRDEEELIVPNATLVQTTVKNYTLRDSVYRLRVHVGVKYSSDMDVVYDTLDEAAHKIEWREKDRTPRIHLLSFGDNAVIWEASVWIQNPWLAPRLLSRFHQAVWKALKEKEIEIAFPQLDLHLDPEVQAGLLVTSELRRAGLAAEAGTRGGGTAHG